MKLKNESVFVGNLTTLGRKTGEPRTVELRLVYTNGNFYATSSKVDTKHWCRNMMKNPAVQVTACGERYACVAQPVRDERLRRRILTLRDSPALMERVVFEITPRKQPVPDY
jgi:deazaflavin-dependent oxidoreductase (nitroreductase family)